MAQRLHELLTRRVGAASAAPGRDNAGHESAHKSTHESAHESGLTEKNLKVEKASAAVIDATIIQTAGSKQRQAIEVDEEGQVSGQTTPGKDKDARWTKKNGLYKLGYKQHTRTDEEGYIEKLHITPANTHECNHLSPLLEGIAEGTTVYADKVYDSKENRQHLKEHRLLDGIMRKACRNRPLTEVQTKRNRYLSKTRYSQLKSK